MSDAELDQKLRAMSVELAESSPAAPTYEELHERAGVAVTEIPVVPSARPEDGPRRPGFWQKTLGILGVGVAVGGGAFALAALTEDDGADTPEAAVGEFIEAVAAEDAIGVGETLVPSERDLVLEYLDPILTELQRRDIAAADADARDVSGLEFTADLTSLRMQESPLTDVVTRVRILDGDLRFDGDYGALPVGDGVRADGPLDDPDPVDLLVDVFGGQADVVTVKDGDSWRVSVFYTLAEYLRADRGLPAAGMGGGPVPVGAESPDALMAAVIDGAVAGDFATLLTLADPIEGAVLYDYWPVFEPDWSDSLTRTLAEGPYADVRSYETAVTGDGSERVISLTTWDYAFSVPWPWDPSVGVGETAVTFDGQCFTTTPLASDIDGYTPPPSEGCLGDTAEYEGVTLSAQRSGLVDFAVVERDGRWYVRPGATLIESWLGATEAVGVSEGVHVFSLVWRAFPAPPTVGFGAVGGPLFGVTGSEESFDEGVQGVPVPNCDPTLDDAAMAGCLADIFGAEVDPADVAACRATVGEGSGDELERSWELEGCIAEILYPPTPRDLFLQELATCPGGTNPQVAEMTPEEQGALVECARGIFEGGTVPDEILTGLATCLGVEPDALPAVTDAQALVTCGVEVIAGPQAVQEDGVDQTIVIDPSATSLPVPTSIEAGQD